MITQEQTIGTPVFKNVFPRDAKEIIDSGGADVVVIDVCKPDEYETAHIEGAINIDYFSKLFTARLDTLDRDRTYVVYCRMGARSALALKAMKKLGFRTVYNIIGGTLLWEEEGLPFATGRGPSKWVACPFSITLIAGLKAKRALRSVYGALGGLLRSVSPESPAGIQGGDPNVQH